MPDTTRRRRCSAWLGTSVTVLLLATVARPAAAQRVGPSLERKVQAGFLLNFARYVEWPAEAFPTAGSPLRIGVLGDDPFGVFLDQTVQGETVNGHGVVVQRSQAVDTLRECQIVFVSRSAAVQEGKDLAVLAGRPILTVGEVAGFAHRGGVVNFYLDNARVRFEISRLASERAGLKVSPQLLRLARIVYVTSRERLHAGDDGTSEPRRGRLAELHGTLCERACHHARDRKLHRLGMPARSAGRQQYRYEMLVRRQGHLHARRLLPVGRKRVEVTA